jgi:hypothetical protein
MPGSLGLAAGYHQKRGAFEHLRFLGKTVNKECAMYLNRSAAFAATMTLFAVGLAGCYETIEPAASEAQTAPSTSTGGSSVTRSGSSALGGAKRAAEGVASDLQHRQQEIADGLDGNLDDY